jgi:hypothetical protein
MVTYFRGHTRIELRRTDKTKKKFERRGRAKRTQIETEDELGRKPKGRREEE